eukprot:evm.model.NODE_4038_length_3987_cov_22.595436.1
MEFASTGPSSSASSTPSPLSPPPQPPNVPLPENATVVPLDPLRAPVELQRYYPSAIAAASAAASSSSLLRLIPGTSGAAGAMSGSGVMKDGRMKISSNSSNNSIQLRQIHMSVGMVAAATAAAGAVPHRASNGSAGPTVH